LRNEKKGKRGRRPSRRTSGLSLLHYLARKEKKGTTHLAPGRRQKKELVGVLSFGMFTKKKRILSLRISERGKGKNQQAQNFLSLSGKKGWKVSSLRSNGPEKEKSVHVACLRKKKERGSLRHMRPSERRGRTSILRSLLGS